MFLGDSHTHSRRSPDADYPMWDMIAGAAQAGLTYLCNTDHCDLRDLHGVFCPTYDWPAYQADFEEAQRRLPPNLALGRGLELGGAYEDAAAARAILAGEPRLDFVIGSVHNFRTMMDKRDFYNEDYSDRAFCVATLNDYLGSLEELVDLPDCYDTLAHILYPLRYMHRAGQDISLEEGDFPERIRGILKKVVDAGKALEINTWRGRTVAEWEPLLRRFKALGGEYVTVGSDAHRPGDLGKGVREAYELLKTCGYRFTAVYWQRKPQMEAI